MRDDLRSGSVATRVKNLVREATNLKTSQFTGWDSIQCYKIDTTNQWDLDTTSNGATILVRYAADYQDAPFGTLVANLSVDGDSVSYRKTVPGTPPYMSIVEDNSGHGFGKTFDRKPNELYWAINISTPSTNNIKLKVRVFATQPGRLTAGVYNATTATWSYFIQ